MSIPTGAKIIKNKYPARCRDGDGMVPAEDGVAILDPNISTKWSTFHLACLPAPYEEADVPASITLTVPYRHKGPAAPGHERCGVCSHWAQDHTASGCTGSFRSAGACTCTAFAVAATVHTINSLNAGLISQATASATIGGGYAAVAQATQPGIAQSLNIPSDDTSFRLVVFYGNIKSAYDGQVHFVGANTVLDLHGITVNERYRIPSEFVSEDAKRLYRPRAGDYIIGPRYQTREYAAASLALRARLEQEGWV